MFSDLKINEISLYNAIKIFAKNWISKLPRNIKLKPLIIKTMFSDLKINEISLYNAIKILPKIGFRSFPVILN